MPALTLQGCKNRKISLTLLQKICIVNTTKWCRNSNQHKQQSIKVATYGGSQVKQLVDVLKAKKNLILQGAPGTRRESQTIYLDNG